MIDDVSNRLSRTGSRAFTHLTLHQAVRKVFAGWDEALAPDEAHRESHAIFVYTRNGSWAAFEYPAGQWSGYSHTARHRSLLNLFRNGGVVAATTFPDLIEGMTLRSHANPFSPWVMAALQMTNYPNPEHEATAALLALGGCGDLMGLHAELVASLEKMRSELEQQFAAVSEAKKKRAATP
jgi:hypothetical protein